MFEKRNELKNYGLINDKLNLNHLTHGKKIFLNNHQASNYICKFLLILGRRIISPKFQEGATFLKILKYSNKFSLHIVHLDIIVK